MKHPKDKRRELALKLSNDIAEGIDCGESRKQLRDAISWWADQVDLEIRRYNDLLNRLMGQAAELLKEYGHRHD